MWLERYPDAIDHFADIEKHLTGKHIAVFLDYDGTLTPIVRNPDRALISEDMRSTVRHDLYLYDIPYDAVPCFRWTESLGSIQQRSFRAVVSIRFDSLWDWTSCTTLGVMDWTSVRLEIIIDRK